eukprot:SAG11_NODE_5057_length_1677_cov_1.780735_1_plen_105_part_00
MATAYLYHTYSSRKWLPGYLDIYHFILGSNTASQIFENPIFPGRPSKIVAKNTKIETEKKHRKKSHFIPGLRPVLESSRHAEQVGWCGLLVDSVQCAILIFVLL